MLTYSRQPFEPVYDMHTRSNSKIIVYEEVETVVIMGKGEQYKLASVPYGMLAATCESMKSARALRKSLNKKADGGLKFQVSDLDQCEDMPQYLPNKIDPPAVIPRLRPRVKNLGNLSLLDDNEFADLRSIAEKMTRGLYLCKYNDNNDLIRIKLLAVAERGSPLISLKNSLGSSMVWKFAIIDYRAERTCYASDLAEEKKYSASNDSDTLTQLDIDKLFPELKGLI